jgi:hypothetical protein
MAGQELDLEAIVREVLRRLQQLGGGPAVGDQARDGAGTAKATPVVLPALPSAPLSACEPGRLRLEQRTITLGLIRDRLQGVKEVLVSPGAVVTPSVRDELRKRRITLRFRSELPDDSPVPAGVVLGVAGGTNATGAALAAVTAETAGAERIDRDCILEVVRHVSQAVAGHGRIGVVLTDRPAVALCLANRQTSVRAAWGVSVASVREAAKLIGANLLVVNPAQHGLYELRGMIREFVGGRHECPKTYRLALGGEA